MHHLMSHAPPYEIGSKHLAFVMDQLFYTFGFQYLPQRNTHKPYGNFPWVIAWQRELYL